MSMWWGIREPLLLKLELERRGYTVAIHQLLDRKKAEIFHLEKAPCVGCPAACNDDQAIHQSR